MSGQTTKIENILKSLPEGLFEFVNPENSPEQRLMAAQGAIPLTPKDLAKILFCLTFDTDENIKNEATKSLNELPGNIMTEILVDNSTIPEFLDYVAKNIENESYVESVLLNSNTFDSTYAYLAKTQHSQSNIEIIANNKQRILRSIDIVECLDSNPAISRSTLDGVLSFISLYLEKDQKVKKLIKDTELDKQEDIEVSAEELEELEEVEESFFDEIEIPDELIAEYDDEDESESFRDSILFKIKSLNIAEKIKVAIQGNMETRRILIRDSNRIISSAVLKNPRLSDMEIVLISQSKVVDEEVLRQVADTKKWTRLYQVKTALVNNPKTPVHISMNFLRHLRSFDLKAIQFNKNLPNVISDAARRISKEGK
ncbi:MAG: hypothetical protein ACR2NW_03845 [Thermodesulfobacteriota bacterium]